MAAVTAPAPPSAPARRRTRRWLVFVAVAWAVALAAAAYVSSRTDEATIREQTSVTDARPTVSRTVTDLVAASGDAVVSVGPFSRAGECRISVARHGERWEQTVTFYPRQGDEPGLLDQLSKGLPGSYRPRVRHGTLRGDAGNFVTLSGGRASPGEVRIVVDTGCRAGTAPTDGAAGRPSDGGAPVDAVLAALHLSAAEWRTTEVLCLSGGAMRVVTADSEPDAVPGPLPSALAAVGPGAVVARPELYAYRAGATSVVARLHEGVVTVTATTACQ
jgi:hypothetical protein